jgi:hypothetical protein
MLGVLLHAPRGPFYSPKAARSRWEHSRKAIFAFCRLAHLTVRCTTGHCPVRISFLLWRSRPLEFQSRWCIGHCPVHTGQSCAPFWSLALPRVARGLRGRPLARSTDGSPDSPVNFSRTPPPKSREQLVDRRQPDAPDTVRCTTGHCPVHHRTVRCTTGQSGAPRLSSILAVHIRLLQNCFSCF